MAQQHTFNNLLHYLRHYWIPNKLTELKLTDITIAAAALASLLVALGQYEMTVRTLDALGTANAVAKEQSAISRGQLQLSLAQAEDSAEADTNRHAHANLAFTNIEGVLAKGSELQPIQNNRSTMDYPDLKIFQVRLDLQPNVPLKVDLEVSNVGRVPAINVRAFGVAEAIDSSSSPVFIRERLAEITKEADKIQQRSATIKPNESFINELAGYKTTEKLYSALLAGKMRLYILGRVNYSDASSHVVTLSYVYKVTREGNSWNLALVSLDESL